MRLLLLHMEAVLIFPHQLFQEHPSLVPTRTVYLIEHRLFFSYFPFHKQKLVLHRASMKAYQHDLERAGHRVVYVEHAQASLQKLLNSLRTEGYQRVYFTDPVDDYLSRRLAKAISVSGLTAHQLESPNFLTTSAQFDDYKRKEKRYFMANFYIWQRKRMDIMVDGNGQPAGGSWSFDAANRERVPAGLAIPKPVAFPASVFVQEACNYVNRTFPHHYGTTDGFAYPVTVADASKALDDFLENRLQQFGAYEDAIVQREPVLFHSLLSPLLNIGLLSPQQILKRTFAYHKRKKYPLNSLEGFVRQIIGWREFIRAVYQREGAKQRTANYFRLQQPIPKSFYQGTTGIPPVDDTISKVLATGYCHHIERLMVLGNFMHLCGFHPDAVYQWFMELFIDAYDWVMVPNVYGMTQYADGGLMTTKPYVSGSNYILKMSDYKKGPWCAVWDALYWRYILQHADDFRQNHRMRMITSVADKMTAEKKTQYLDTAEQFLRELHSR